jgi:AraC-like DNA-binding protein
MIWTTPGISLSTAATTVGLRREFQLGGYAPPIVGHYLNDEVDPELKIDFHEALEFGIVLRGTLEKQWGAHAFELTPGDVWLCGMWEPHGTRRPTAGSESVVLVFLPESLMSVEDHTKVTWQALFTTPPESRPGILPIALRAAMREEGEAIAREIREVRLGWSSALIVHLLRCLWQIAVHWEQVQPETMTDGASPEILARIRPALHLVSGEKGKVDLLQAAALCGLSRTRFSVLFTKTMGTSFGQFCLRVRLGHVARLLLTTDHTIENISDNLGFSSTAHLHRLFLKHYKCTPRAFREGKALD